jgi:hypothetical protein
MRNTSPCFQVRGLQIFPNRLLLIPHRDANTAARISMYMAKLVCCVFGPVRSIDGPAINPANKDLHFAVLKLQSYFYQSTSKFTTFNNLQFIERNFQTS